MTGEFLKFYRRQKFFHLCLQVANNRFHDHLVIKVFTVTLTVLDRVPVSVSEWLIGSFVLILITLWWLCVFLLVQQSYFQRVRWQCCLHRPDHPDHRRHHCVLLVVPMFEYSNHAVAITKAVLAHTFLTATFWKVPIPKRYPSFSDFPLFLGPRAPLVQPSIGSVCSFVRANSLWWWWWRWWWWRKWIWQRWQNGASSRSPGGSICCFLFPLSIGQSSKSSSSSSLSSSRR